MKLWHVRRGTASQFMFMLVVGMLLMLALAAASLGAEVRIVAPVSPVQPNAIAVLPVEGLVDLSTAKVECIPAPTLLFPIKTWDGMTAIFFQAATPGKYSVTVSVNGWRRDLDAAIARIPAQAVKTEVLAELTKAAAAMAAAYPLVHETAALEVAGQLPPPGPVPDPKPDPKPNLKVTKATYVFEKDQTSVPRAVTAALNKISAESSGSIVVAQFDDDVTNGLGTVPAQYKIAIAKAREEGLPALVVQSGDVVTRVVKNPLTEAQVLEALK